jgi:ubiquinone/menaquinone biosynthesis C-methylase UbiE
MSRTNERWQRYWDRKSKHYDREMGFFDRRLFRGSREWVCRQATGEVLEVAIGTGLNLPHYPQDVRLSGIDYSPAMLELARRRASELGRQADLRAGDAEALDFPDSSFDTVVCTYGLCAIPNDEQAVTEMRRVLRPGGLRLLADHVEGSTRAVRALQRLLEMVSVRQASEHFRRRPHDTVLDAGFEIERQERFALGIVERLAARKPRPSAVGHQPPVE